MATKYQTLSGFLIAPFKNRNINKDATFDSMYRSYIQSNKIKIAAVCEIEESYYIHVKIPSESQKGGEYDVVIRFFTDNPETLSQNTISNYYIQFFSNSPSFMYKYAYLYNKEGYLIEALYDKIDADYINTPPEKTNKDNEMSYDKSIYLACRFLSEQKFRYLDKRGYIKIKKVPSTKFFSNISDFKSVKLDQTIMNEEKKLKELIRDKAPKSLIGKAKSVISSNKIEAKHHTSGLNDSSFNRIKKTGSKTKITGVKKKSSSNSTRRK